MRQFIAETFIRKTRFDPLHDATTEQRLVDQLPGAGSRNCAKQEQTVVSMQFGDRPLKIEIERAQLIAALEPHYVELLRLVQGARVAGMQIQLRSSPRIAAFPGLLDRFGTLRDCEIRAAAARRRCFRHACSTKPHRRPDSLALVYHLPIARAAGGEIGCRAGRDAYAATADASAVPGPRVAHLGPTAR